MMLKMFCSKQLDPLAVRGELKIFERRLVMCEQLLQRHKKKSFLYRMVSHNDNA